MASIAAGKVLPVRDFALEQLQDDTIQRLDGFLNTVPDAKAPKRTTENAVQLEGEERELAYFRNAALTPAAFIKSYFEHSRLHFIGTWKMRIEAFTLKHKHAGPKPIRTRTKASGYSIPEICQLGGERVILHIDMDCFFASVALLTRPELKEVPFVVCHSGNANSTAEISCANYPARKFGIHAGSFISSALELCPSLTVVPYQFQQYHEISEQAIAESCFFEIGRA